MKQVAVFVAAAAFSVAAPIASAYAETAGPINVVGVENEYADVISQIGGKFVTVQAIETDPNTDPHTFEASPSVAKRIAAAGLIIVNGVGYDDWADKIMSATPRPNRKVINVQKLLGLPDDTANPHLWYDPKTMPAVAKAVADALAELKPVRGLVFPRQRRQVCRLAGTMDCGDRSLQGEIREYADRHHRAGLRLPVAGDGFQADDAVQSREGDHGRHGPFAAGRDHSRTTCSPAIR